jgi:uncharacterized metal-binding protein YceD (DUF177 family)
MNTKHNQPLHWPVKVNVLPSSGFDLAIKASPEECKLLAEKADIEAVREFSAELVFRRWRRQGVMVRGEISAEIIQACSVTLDPLDVSIHGEVDRLFLPEGSRLLKPSFNDEGEMLIDAEGPDLPEPFNGETIDAWPILVEQLILEIDPFLRKPEAELPELAEEADEDEEDSNPFSQLKQMFKQEKGH